MRWLFVVLAAFTARAPRASLVAFLFACVLAPSAAAQTQVPQERIEGGAAIDSQTVIAYASQICPEAGQKRLVISHDRGRTWTAGPQASCDTWGYVHLATYAGLVQVGSNRFVGADLVPRTLPPGGEGQLPWPELVTPGAIYVSAHLMNPGDEMRWWRMRDDWSGWVRCGDPAPPAGFAPTGQWHTSRVVVREFRSGDQVAWFASRDRCASWKQVPYTVPATCTDGQTSTPLSVQRSGHHRILITCLSPLGMGSYAPSPIASSDDGATWSSAATNEDLEPLHERRWVHVDKWSDPAAPHTWPATRTLGADDPGMSAAQQEMITWLNARYRRPLGLPDLRYDARLAAAAAGHVAYTDLHGWRFDGAVSNHYQTPGLAGFTGAGPWDRCDAQGYSFPDPGDRWSSGSCTEGMSYGRGSLISGARSLMNVPYHGDGLFVAREVGAAVGSPTFTWNYAPTKWVTGDVADFDAPVNSAESGLRVWPADGTTDVPVAWGGSEAPDPLRNYTGDRANIGPPLYVISHRRPLTIELSGPDGALPILIPGGTEAHLPGRLDERRAAGLHSTGVLPAARLRPDTTYTLTVTDGGGLSGTMRFRTAAEGSWSGGGSPPPRALPRVLRLGAPGARLRVRGQRLQVAVSARLPAGARGRTLRIEYRRGTRWVRAAQLRVPANARIARTITLNRARIGGPRVRTLRLRMVLTAATGAPRVNGATRIVRVPASRPATSGRR